MPFFLVKLPTSVFSPWSLDPWILKEILWICKCSYSFFTCEMRAHLPRPPDCRIMQQKYIGPNPIRDSVARGRYPSLHVQRDPLNSGNLYLWKAVLNYTKLHSKHIDNWGILNEKENTGLQGDIDKLGDLISRIGGRERLPTSSPLEGVA